MTAHQASTSGDDSPPAIGASRRAPGDARLEIAAGVLLLVGIVAAVYGPVVSAPTMLDDRLTLEKNPSLLKPWPLWDFSGGESPLQPSPGTPVSARPLVNLTFAINYHFAGSDPAGYHWSNIGIVLLSAFVLWALVRRTLRLEYFDGRFNGVAGMLGYASALVWVLHPLNSECFAYVTQRTESLMGLFYFATLYAAVRYWSSPSTAARVIWLVAATVLCQLGSLSKEMIASLPAVALVYERTFVTGSFRRAIAESWPLYVGLALAWIPQVAMNYRGARTPAAGFELGLPAYMWWFTQAEVLLLYLRLTVWPYPLQLFYEIPYKETLSAALPWLVPVGLLAAATAYLLWRRTSAGFVALTTWAVLSPTLIVPLVGEIVAERRMYVALGAIAPLAVAGGYELLRRLVGRRALWPTLAGCAALCTLYAVLDVKRVSLYSDVRSLLADTAMHDPDNLSVMINLGIAQERIGQHHQARQSFAEAARLFEHVPILNYRLNPDAPSIYLNLALVDETDGHDESALRHLRRALELNPDYWQAHYALGQHWDKLGQSDQARDEYKAAVRLNPQSSAAHLSLGLLLAKVGDTAGALQHIAEGSAPTADPGAFVSLADAYALTVREEEAVLAAREALQLAREQKHDALAKQLESWLEKYGTHARDS